MVVTTSLFNDRASHLMGHPHVDSDAEDEESDEEGEDDDDEEEEEEEGSDDEKKGAKKHGHKHHHHHHHDGSCGHHHHSDDEDEDGEDDSSGEQVTDRCKTCSLLYPDNIFESWLGSALSQVGCTNLIETEATGCDAHSLVVAVPNMNVVLSDYFVPGLSCR